MIVLFTARGAAAGFFQTVYVYTPEVYPTKLRALAMGESRMLMREILRTSYSAEKPYRFARTGRFAIKFLLNNYQGQYLALYCHFSGIFYMIRYRIQIPLANILYMVLEIQSLFLDPGSPTQILWFDLVLAD